jgi:hypothetical protein
MDSEKHLSDAELRLECLRVAANRKSHMGDVAEMVKMADDFWKFVESGAVPEQSASPSAHTAE